jgi:predicted permease
LSDVAQIVLSIFGLIGIGYALARTGYLGESVGDGLSDFVFNLAIPVLLFKTLAQADFHGASPWGLWAGYFGGVAVVWALAHRMIRSIFGRDARAAVVAGVSASFANTVMLGIPLIQSAFGEAGMVSILIVISINMPVMMFASIVANEWAMRADGLESAKLDRMALVRRFVSGLVTNPIIVGIAIGALWRLTGLPVSGVPAMLVDSLSSVAGPMALLASGMGLARYGISGNIRPALLITVLKLAVMPAVVLAIGFAVGLQPLALAVVTMTAASPTGVNAFLIANRFGTGQALASNSMTISTAIAVATTVAWFLVLAELGIMPGG